MATDPRSSRQAPAAAALSVGPARAGQRSSDLIIETLRRDIVSGQLAQGSRLPTERELAAHYGVSQPTIREVERALDVMGLIDVRHGSGAYVRGDSAYLMATALQTMLQIERVSIIEVLDVRELLGCESVRIAATVSEASDLARLEDRIGMLDDADAFPDVEALIEALASFQRGLSAAAHNPLLLALEQVLINLLLNIQIKALSSRGLRFWRERSTRFQPDRRAIVDAIEARDAERSRSAMKAYLNHQRTEFAADPQFSSMRLSDAKAVGAAADIVLAARAG